MIFKRILDSPILLAAYGVVIAAAFFGFTNPILHIPFAVLLFPLGLFFIGITAVTRKRALLHGFLAGGIACTLCFYWLVVPLNTYGGFPLAAAFPAPILMGAYFGLYTGLFSLGARAAASRIHGLSLCIFAGLSWALLEVLRGWLFTGFPWLLLPSAFVGLPFMIQTVSLVGVYGLSALFAVAAIGIGTALIPDVNKKSRIRCLAVGILLFAGIAGFGAYSLQQPLQAAGDAVKIGIVQGNIDQSVKWNNDYQNATISRYLTLTKQAVEKEDPRLVVWPETATPFYFQEHAPLSLRVKEFMAEQESFQLLLGTPAYTYHASTKQYSFYNRAYLLNIDGSLGAKYDKEHLVPFGEYMPLKEYLPFMNKLTQGAAEDFSPGRTAAPLKSGNLALGMLICYEAVFPALVQDRVEAGADVLINISNDAWYGRTSAPHQHLRLSALRSVEQGRWMVRSTNTGISCFIDPKGRIHEPTRLFKAEYVGYDIEPITEKTVYHHLHGRIIPGMLLAALMLIALPARRKPINNRPQ